MVTKNRGEGIGKTIKSLLDQCFIDWELIVKDGESTDNTIAILEEIADARIKIYSSKDTGIYDAINQGLASCSGEIVGFLHVGDFLERGTLRAVFDEFHADRRLDGVYGGVNFIDQSGQLTRRWRPGKYYRGLEYFGWMPPHPCLFVKRHWYHEIQFSTDFRISGDYDWLLRFLKFNPQLSLLRRNLMIMDNGGASRVSFSNQMRKSREDFLAARRSLGVMALLAVLLKPMIKLNQFIR